MQQVMLIMPGGSVCCTQSVMTQLRYSYASASIATSMTFADENLPLDIFVVIL
jgi:hypothetical protein